MSVEDFTQGSTGILRIDVRGSALFGRIAVAAMATLDGALTTVFVDTFTPSVGNEFDVLSYGFHTGQFSMHTGNGVTYEADYGVDKLTLRVTALNPISAGVQMRQLSRRPVLDQATSDSERAKTDSSDEPDREAWDIALLDLMGERANGK
jgi:hypothetical protein